MILVNFSISHRNENISIRSNYGTRHAHKSLLNLLLLYYDNYNVINVRVGFSVDNTTDYNDIIYKNFELSSQYHLSR